MNTKTAGGWTGTPLTLEQKRDILKEQLKIVVKQIAIRDLQAEAKVIHANLIIEQLSDSILERLDALGIDPVDYV